MYLQKPSLIWIEILPALLLLSWIIGEAWRWRRLKKFGDPQVLGVSVPWALRITALFFLVLGIAFAAAIIPLPATKAASEGAGVPVVEILVDVHALQNAGEGIWEAFDDTLHELIDRNPGMPFTAVALDSPEHVLVYATLDTQGLRMALARLRFEAPSGKKPDSAQEISNYAASRHGRIRTTRTVLFTASPADSLERLTAAVNAGNLDVTIVNISGSSQPVLYGYKDAGGNLGWSEKQEDLQRNLTANAPGRTRGTNPDLTQWCALLAVIFLCAEDFFGLAARTRRRPVV